MIKIKKLEILYFQYINITMYNPKDDDELQQVGFESPHMYRQESQSKSGSYVIAIIVILVCGFIYYGTQVSSSNKLSSHQNTNDIKNTHLDQTQATLNQRKDKQYESQGNLISKNLNKNKEANNFQVPSNQQNVVSQTEVPLVSKSENQKNQEKKNLEPVEKNTRNDDQKDKQISTLKYKIISQENQKNYLTGQLKEIKEEYEGYKDQVQLDKNNKIIDHNKLIGDLNNQIATLKQSVSIKQKLYLELESKQKAENIEIERLKTQIQGLKLQISQSEQKQQTEKRKEILKDQQNGKNIQTINNLKQKITVLEGQVQKYKDLKLQKNQLQLTQQEQKKLQQSIFNHNKQINNLNQEITKLKYLREKQKVHNQIKSKITQDKSGERVTPTIQNKDQIQPTRMIPVSKSKNIKTVPQNHIEKPIDTPTKKPIDTPIDTTTEKPIGNPTEKPIDTPIEKPIDTPIDTTTEKPIGNPTVKPIEKFIEKNSQNQGNIANQKAKENQFVENEHKINFLQSLSDKQGNQPTDKTFTSKPIEKTDLNTIQNDIIKNIRNQVEQTQEKLVDKSQQNIPSDKVPQSTSTGKSPINAEEVTPNNINNRQKFQIKYDEKKKENQPVGTINKDIVVADNYKEERATNSKEDIVKSSSPLGITLSLEGQNVLQSKKPKQVVQIDKKLAKELTHDEIIPQTQKDEQNVVNINKLPELADNNQNTLQMITEMKTQNLQGDRQNIYKKQEQDQQDQQGKKQYQEIQLVSDSNKLQTQVGQKNNRNYQQEQKQKQKQNHEQYIKIVQAPNDQKGTKGEITDIVKIQPKLQVLRNEKVQQTQINMKKIQQKTKNK